MQRIQNTYLSMIAGCAALTAGATLGLWVRPALAQDAGGGKIQSNVVPWKDPKENAFSLEAPEGWEIGGGLNRNGKSRFNQSVQAFGRTAICSFRSATPDCLRSCLSMPR